jgi:hypothetical protein
LPPAVLHRQHAGNAASAELAASSHAQRAIERMFHLERQWLNITAAFRSVLTPEALIENMGAVLDAGDARDAGAGANLTSSARWYFPRQWLALRAR